MRERDFTSILSPHSFFHSLWMKIQKRINLKRSMNYMMMTVMKMEMKDWIKRKRNWEEIGENEERQKEKKNDVNELCCSVLEDSGEAKREREREIEWGRGREIEWGRERNWEDWGEKNKKFHLSNWMRHLFVTLFFLSKRKPFVCKRMWGMIGR